MRVFREADADRELREAFEYIAGQSVDAAERYLSDFDATITRIVQFPNAHPPLRSGFRRILLTRFPYQVIYRVEDDAIRIYAVAHLKRRPGYWRRRMSRLQPPRRTIACPVQVEALRLLHGFHLNRETGPRIMP